MTPNPLISLNGATYTAEQASTLAINEYKHGNAQTAVDIFTAIIAAIPRYIDAYNNRGFVLQNMQRYKEALKDFDKVIKAKPDYAVAHANRGITLHRLQRHREALVSYDRAISLNPSFADTHCSRGDLLLELQRYGDALASYEKAIALMPGVPTVYCNRGFALEHLKRYDEALASYGQAIAISPEFAEAHFNLGNVLNAMKRYDDAVSSYGRAIVFKPDYVEAYYNGGNCLRARKRYGEALASYEAAIRLKPDHFAAYNNLGLTLQTVGNPKQAIAHYDSAIAANPAYVAAYNSRGIAFEDLRRYDEALASYDKALSIDPTDPDAHWNKGLLFLLLGRYEEGWRFYEWRWKMSGTKQHEIRAFGSPLWRGKEPLESKTILLYAEQGLGDTIQFCRYLPMVAAQGAKIIFEVPASLAGIMSTLEAPVQILERGNPHPTCDYHCPLLSLPLAFNTLVETIPADVPYLSADSLKRKAWQERLGEKTQSRIGLVPSGGAHHNNDHNRSIALSLLLPLLDCGADFHLLQKDVRPDDEAISSNQGAITSHATELQNFAETAALVSEMDLIISVDTSVAHLAGALGKTVWILLPYAPDFRWLTEREDSPWYPTARLFRQERAGDWQSVVARVKAELEVFLPPR